MPAVISLLVHSNILQETYKSDFVLYPGIIRLGPFKQALQKPKLKLESTSNFIPAAVLTVLTAKAGVSAKPFVMLPHGVERSYSDLQGFPHVHPVSRHLVQKEVVGLL